VLRGNRGDAAGTELGSSFVERITVNTGTASVLPAPAHPVRRFGLGASSADRIGGGAEPSYYSEPGKARHMGKDGSGYEKGRRLQCRKMHHRMVARLRMLGL